MVINEVVGQFPVAGGTTCSADRGSTDVGDSVRKRRRRTGLWGGVLALILTLCGGVTTAPAASANTPLTWSTTVSGTSITIGWTTDHAWVIADYADVITRGAGFVAGEVCSVLGGEDGFPNPVGMLCSQSVQSAVSQALAGNPALTNHGLWVAVYSPSNIHFGSW